MMVPSVLSYILMLSFTIVDGLLNESNTESVAFTGENYPDPFRKVLPVLYINCLENCDPPLPQLQTVLETGCVTDCKGSSQNFRWTITPTLPSNLISYEKKKAILKIKPHAFSINTVATFMVSTEEAKTSMTLSFGKIPRLSIHCQENCNKFNVGSQIVLTATCEKDCDMVAESNYKWTIRPFAPDTTTTGQNLNTIIIPPNTLKGGQKVTAAVTNGGGNTSFVFATAGGCDILPKRGYIDTVFALTCSYNETTQIEVHQMIGPQSDPHDVSVYKGLLKGNGFQLQEGDPAMIKVVIPKDNVTLELLVYVRRRDDRDEIVIKTCGTRDDSLSTLAGKQDFEGFIKQATLLINDLQNVSDPEFKTHFFRHIIADVVLEANKIDPNHLMYFLQNIIDLENRTEISTVSLLTECLKAISYKIKEKSRHGGYVEMERDADILLTMAAKLIHATQNSSVEPLAESFGDYPSYGQLAPIRTRQMRAMQRTIDDLIDVIDIVGRMEDEGGNHVADIKAVDFQSTTVKLPWRLPATIQTIPGENTTRVEISQLLAERLSYEGGPMYCHVAVINSNFFWWQEHGPQINTDFILLDIFTKRKNITNLDGDIDIFLRRNPWEPGIISEELLLGEDPWRVHKLTIKNNTMLTVNFKIVDNEYYAFANFTYPSLDQIRNEGRRIIRGGSRNRWIIASNDTIVFVAVARTLGKPLKYEMEVGETGCAHWEGNSWEWENNDCRLGPNTTDNITHCQCHHLSLIVGTFFIPPNAISFFCNTTFTAKLQKTELVLGVLAGVVVSWTLLMVWAAGRDAMLQRRRVHRLPDTVPGDSHSYLVGVTTGLWQGAGTSARVAIQLLGTESNSRVHLMYGIGMLQQGAEDWFVVQTPKALGIIRAVRFYHDSYGFNPHWYCERVEVRDFVERRKYVFHAQKWFSLIWGDGNVDRIFSKTEESVLQSGGVLFPHRVCTEMRDNHMWLSVFTRPLDSTYTTKERVIAAASLMFLSLTTSAMFYGAGRDSHMDPNGSFEFTSREVRIIFQTVLIVVPYGVIITTLFRRSLPPRYF